MNTMINNYYYTESEKEELVKSITILVDTKEKEGKNQHILDYFDRKGIPYKRKSLRVGDYSFFIPTNEKLGILKPLYFDQNIIIERKANLEEISGNLSKDRARLEKEFATAPKIKVLLIENASYADIIEGNYDTQYGRKSFLATLQTFWFRYDLPVFFMQDKKYSGLFIRQYFEYYFKEYIR